MKRIFQLIDTSFLPIEVWKETCIFIQNSYKKLRSMHTGRNTGIIAAFILFILSGADLESCDKIGITLLSSSWMGWITTRSGALVSCILTSMCLMLPAKGESWEGAKVTKTVVDPDPRPINATAMALSMTRNGCRVAIVGGDLIDGFFVRLDGVDGPRYDDIRMETPVFSENGASVAYCAMKDSKWRWVINGVEGPAFDKLTATSFALSANGKRHAYIAQPRIGREVLVVDGKLMHQGTQGEARPYDAAPLFNPDGSRLAYVEKVHDRRFRMNLDGKAGPWTQGVAMMRKSRGFGAYRMNQTARGITPRSQPPVFSMAFSANGKHFAYFEFVDRRQRLVIDGVPLDSLHESAGMITFSPDGGDFAYMAVRGGKRYIFRKGGKPLEIEAIADYSLAFSPDGRHWAFAGIREGRNSVWMDGEAVPVNFEIQNAFILDLYFSPDSKRLAYCADGPKGRHWVVDGKGGPAAMNTAESFDFSPDSAHFCYLMLLSEGKGVGIVVDGVVRATHGEILGAVFLNDGTLEYLAKDEKIPLTRFRITGY